MSRSCSRWKQICRSRVIQPFFRKLDICQNLSISAKWFGNKFHASEDCFWIKIVIFLSLKLSATKRFRFFPVSNKKLLSFSRKTVILIVLRRIQRWSASKWLSKMCHVPKFLMLSIRISPKGEFFLHASNRGARILDHGKNETLARSQVRSGIRVKLQEPHLCYNCPIVSWSPDPLIP